MFAHSVQPIIWLQHWANAKLDLATAWHILQLSARLIRATFSSSFECEACCASSFLSSRSAFSLRRSSRISAFKFSSTSSIFSSWSLQLLSKLVYIDMHFSRQLLVLPCSCATDSSRSAIPVEVDVLYKKYRQTISLSFRFPLCLP